jgi:hypothetical protein
LAFSSKRYDICVKAVSSSRTVVKLKAGIEGIKRTGKRRGVYRFYWENLKERDHLEDPDIDGSIILRWIVSKWDEEAWTGLGQETDRWRAIVNVVMYFRIP